MTPIIFVICDVKSVVTSDLQLYYPSLNGWMQPTVP